MKCNRKLPTAFIVGPMRTATTWIYEYLKIREDICLPKGVKETFFYNLHFNKGIGWYLAHFSHCIPAKQLIIEVAPSYFHFKDVPERIRNTCGDIKILVIVRNPIERSISHYLHLKSCGKITGSLQQAIEQCPEIVEASKYYHHLERWHAVFGDNVKLINYKFLDNNPPQFVKSLCNALGIPFVRVPEGLMNRIVNPPYKTIHPALAKCALRFSQYLRSKRLHYFVETAKKVGVKRVLFGVPYTEKRHYQSSAQFVSENDKSLLWSILNEDWIAFLNKYGGKLEK